jgi:ABC-2 type transport system ATP-binding protein
LKRLKAYLNEPGVELSRTNQVNAMLDCIWPNRPHPGIVIDPTTKNEYVGESLAQTTRGAKMYLIQRIDELLKRVGIFDRRHTKSSDLSTGLRQKMNIVRGFMTDPEVLFLDEPTLGLDVGASREVRALIREWLDEDKTRTLLLTTHYMVEADELCDRVAIINQGRVLACDTPSALKQRLQKDAIFEFETSPLNGLKAKTIEDLPEVRKATAAEHDGGATLELILVEEGALGAVVNVLNQKNVRILKLSKHEPTLEDVFVDLVGTIMADVEKGGEDGKE